MDQTQQTEKPERDIVQVIDRVVDVIRKADPEQGGPADGGALLIRRLKAVKEATYFTPPECMWIRWRALADVLTDELGAAEPDVGSWQEKVGQIVRAEAS